MRFIPLFKVSDMRAAIRYYTEVLDFVMICPDDTPDSAVVDLGHESMEFQITTFESDRLFWLGHLCLCEIQTPWA
jgi:hypothetical protein